MVPAGVGAQEEDEEDEEDEEEEEEEASRVPSSRVGGSNSNSVRSSKPATSRTASGAVDSTALAQNRKVAQTYAVEHIDADSFDHFGNGMEMGPGGQRTKTDQVRRWPLH